jgi:hypothetical protein
MIVAAHQPNFLPWLGYFDKMRKADLFITVDHVQMELQGFQNRTRIKDGSSVRWITVPVVHASHERVLDKRIDNSREGRYRWGRKMALALKNAYQAAPHYGAFAPALNELLERRWDRLADLNMAMIELCRQALKIKTPIVKSSDLMVTGAKSDMVLELCRRAGAHAYLSGAGASRKYLDTSIFERAGIQVLWQDFPHPRYPQRPLSAPFVEKLSAADLLFNCGGDSAAILRASDASSESRPDSQPSPGAAAVPAGALL